MSRSGYCEEPWDDDEGIRRMNLYRGTVARAIRGKRGQKMLRALRDALEAMSEKRLVSMALIRTDGEVCALGALARHRGIKVEPVEPEGEWDEDVDDEDVPLLAESFDVAESLIREIIYENDEVAPSDPEARWQWVHRWVCRKIKSEVANG